MVRAFIALALATQAALAIPVRWPEGTLRGFPVVRDRNGDLLANSSLSQWLERGNLRVKVVHTFRDGRRIEEQAEMKQDSELQQLRWSFVEQSGESVLRRFEVDFETGSATAEKLQNGELKHWKEALSIERGRTFSGSGFLYAVKNLRQRLHAGDRIQLTAIAFTPKPRTATVTVFFDQVDKLTMGGRSFEADRFTIHPEIPFIARPFVKAPDQRLWFFTESPPGLLRFEGPLAEPYDPIIHIDVIP